MNTTPSLQRLSIDISWRSILKVVAVVLGLYFLYQIRDILALLFVVFIFVAALNPVIANMQRKMPRILAVSIIYVGIFIILIGISTVIFQPLAAQLSNLAQLIPEKLSTVVPLFQKLSEGNDLLAELSSGLQRFSGTLSNVSSNILNATLGLFGGLFTAFTILVLAFYLLLEEKAAKGFINNVVPAKQKDQMMRLLNKISDKMGAWARGQLILMAIIGILDLIVLLILRVESPLPLALWGGVMEVVPYLGPILGALPAVIVALITGTPLQALLVAVLMIVVIQQLEGQVLVPKVMQKAVGLSPVIVIVALLVGGKLFGIVGALLAIPIAAVVAVLVQEWATVQKALNP